MVDISRLFSYMFVHRSHRCSFVFGWFFVSFMSPHASSASKNPYMHKNYSNNYSEGRPLLLHNYSERLDDLKDALKYYSYPRGSRIILRDHTHALPDPPLNLVMENYVRSILFQQNIPEGQGTLRIILYHGKTDDTQWFHKVCRLSALVVRPSQTPSVLE